MENSSQPSQPHLGVFHVSCWIMGLVAFAQLMFIGVAMAFRTNPSTSPEVVTRVVTEYVKVASETPAPVALVQKPLSDEERMAIIQLSNVGPIIESSVLAFAPKMDDPVLERLVEDARTARIAGDTVRAIIKLEEAQQMEPENPHVLYQLAVYHETFGTYETAADYYVEVFNLGPLKAGSLWKKAATKIEKGLVTNITNLASLGAVYKTLPQQTHDGQRRGITLSISVAPGKEIDPMLLRPSVTFFEKADGKITRAQIEESAQGRGNTWLEQPVNYHDGEEMVEVWYLARDQDAREEFIFNKREFYGFVVELYYDDKLVDIKAQPRTLHSEMRSQKAAGDSNWDPELDQLLEALENRGAGDSILPNMDR
ncbi:hypothetical protein N9Z15_01535 [Akkermansiaceae bacterium]|nr:hypothetical protein [Akkermansiaceae bacterium]MDB4386873.1 hypothetical protein [Akkermansiaceae bacterium]